MPRTPSRWGHASIGSVDDVLRGRGVDASRPFVGNSLWVTSVTDPDGYRLEFESPTEVAEETVWEDD